MEKELVLNILQILDIMNNRLNDIEKSINNQCDSQAKEIAEIWLDVKNLL